MKFDFTGVGANLYGGSSKPNTSSSWKVDPMANLRSSFQRANQIAQQMTEIKPFTTPPVNLNMKPLDLKWGSNWNFDYSKINLNMPAQPEPVQMTEDDKPDNLRQNRNRRNRSTEDDKPDEPRQNRNRRNRSTEDKPAQNKPKPDKTEPLQIIEDVKTEPLQIIEDIKPDKPGRNEPKPNKPGQNRPKPIKPVKTEPITVLQVPNITDVLRGSPLTKNVSKGPNNTMLYIAGAVGSVGVIGLGMYFMKSN